MDQIFGQSKDPKKLYFPVLSISPHPFYPQANLIKLPIYSPIYVSSQFKSSLIAQQWTRWSIHYYVCISRIYDLLAPLARSRTYSKLCLSEEVAKTWASLQIHYLRTTKAMHVHLYKEEDIEVKFKTNRRQSNLHSHSRANLPKRATFRHRHFTPLN